MTGRSLAEVFTMIAMIAGALLMPAIASAQATRTPWGHPDLQGIWDFRTITPMERPGEFAGR